MGIDQEPTDGDLEFEAWLGQFRPRAPGPLPLAMPVESIRRSPRPIYAALLAAAGLAAVWFSRGPSTPPEPEPVRALTGQARRLGPLGGRLGATLLESALDAESRAALPDVTQKQGALHALAAVGKDL